MANTLNHLLKDGALTGVTVIDLSRLLPGPYCSMILAEHGARVIAIENKDFKKQGVFLSTVNKNKEHMTLNLKTSAGKKILYKLAREADVIIEGFRPNVVKRLEIDYETIAKINPKIIYCSITGYGQTGYLANRAGHDVNFLGFSGVLDLIGEHDRMHPIPAIQVADIAGGSMNAAIGILLALFAREKTGKGQFIDISMTDGVLGFLSIPLYMYQLTGKIPKRSNDFLSHRYACYNVYETKDNRYLTIGALEFNFWKNLCDYFKAESYIDLQYDDTKRNEIIEFFRNIFKQKTLKTWEKELIDIDICFGPVKKLHEVLNEPLFKQREMLFEIKDEKGKPKHTFGIPIKLSENPGIFRTPPVKFGKNTKSILNELGYDDEQVNGFEKDNVI